MSSFRTDITPHRMQFVSKEHALLPPHVSSCATLGEILRWRASQSPSTVLYRFIKSGELQETVAYGALDARARNIAAQLQAVADIGARIVILLPQDLRYLESWFGILYAGMVAVPNYPPSRADARDSESAGCKRVAALIADAKPTVVIAHRAIAELLEHQLAALSQRLSVRWLAIETLTDPTTLDYFSAQYAEPTLNSDAICHLQYTSGSTATPKGVILTHRNVLANLEMIRQQFGLNESSTGVSWLPFFHDMGLAKVLAPLFVGYPVTVMAPSDFTRRPFRWLKAISDCRATFSGAPNFAYDLCAQSCSSSELDSLDLSTWETAFNGAEPVRAETLSRFRKTFARTGFRPQALRPCYGLAEATVLVSSVPWRETDAESGEEISCGAVSAETDISIVDPNTGAVCREGEQGEILISGPHIGDGYWQRPQESAATFGAVVPGKTQRYLRTGDLGFVRAGEVFITGRIKDLIIVRGRNYLPTDIEAIALRAASVHAPVIGKAAAFSTVRAGIEQLVVALELPKATPSELAKQITQDTRSAIAHDFELHCDEIVLVAERSLPVSSSGKIQRYLCRQQFEQGALTQIATATLANTKSSGAVDTFAFLLKKHPYLKKYLQAENLTQTLESAGFDSLDLAHLAYDLERQFPDFDHEEIDLTAFYALTLEECFLLLEDPSIARFSLLWEKLTRASQIDIRAQIAADASLNELPEHISLPSHGQGILLTGANGFVGSFILYELLKRLDTPIFLLVRASSPLRGMERITESLTRYGLLDEATKNALSARVRVVNGDLEQTRFGLSASDWQDLSETCGNIIHNGAHVNYVAPYSKMKSANVDGTRSIIELATRGARKTIHYISSTFIFGWTPDLVFEHDRNQALAHVDFGYSQSKWGAEQLIWQAIDKGVSARIYRPAMLTASSTEQFSTSDITAALLLYFINFGVVIDMPNQISLMPIDFFAERFVSLFKLGNIESAALQCVMPYANLPQICASITKQFGYQFEPLSLAEFSEHLRINCGPSDLFFPFINFYQRHFRKIELMDRKRYVRTEYERVCTEAFGAVHDPHLDDVVRYIVRFYQSQNLISPALLHVNGSEHAPTQMETHA